MSSDEDFDFDDDEDITESARNSRADSSNSIPSSNKKAGGMAASSAAAGKTGDLDIDNVIAKLLSVKTRNIGLQDDLSEQTIIQLIDRARDLFTS